MMLSRFAFSFIMLVFVVGGATVLNAETDVPSHQNRANLPYGCSTCHAGDNFKYGGGANRCLLCHGIKIKESDGWMTSKQQVVNVAKDFGKNFRHPVFDKRGLHNSKEVLPETNPATPRHADCGDCHNVHQLSVKEPYRGRNGKKTGNFVTAISKEYELCYLCHAESANLPLKSTNKRMEFNTNNPSFHPVEGEGKNQKVVSLLRPYREKKSEPNDISTIKCADCHGSDEPQAPRGPHGSIYQGLLVDSFTTGDNVTENSFTYSLCYRCHKRTSILGNESFPLHSRHITGENRFKGGGTSCNTCHSSHGSIENRYLIRFNRDYVSPSSTGKLKFIEKGSYSFQGECWLSCHGVDHNPKKYPADFVVTPPVVTPPVVTPPVVTPPVVTPVVTPPVVTPPVVTPPVVTPPVVTPPVVTPPVVTPPVVTPPVVTPVVTPPVVTPPVVTPPVVTPPVVTPPVVTPPVVTPPVVTPPVVTPPVVKPPVVTPPVVTPPVVKPPVVAPSGKK